MSKTTLSFEKLNNLLEKYRYEIVRAYSEENDIRLLELKSPHYHKTFYVYVSSRYSLKMDNTIEFFRAEENDSQKTYLELFPDLTDILLLSSSKVCIYIEGTYRFFSFEKEQDIVMENPQQKLIDELEEKFRNMKEQSSLTQNYIFILNTVAKPTPIIFEDSMGNPIEKGSNLEKMIISSERAKTITIDKNTTAVFDFRDYIDLTSSSIQSPDYSDTDDELYQANPPPNNLVNESINIGVIYVCVSINSFMKMIDGFEHKLISDYSTISSKESEMKRVKMQEISEAIEKLKEKSIKELDDIDVQEKELTEQISKLSCILIQCEKMEKTGKKLEEIESVMEDTRTALDELHIKILKLRDTSFDILNKYVKIVNEL